MIGYNLCSLEHVSFFKQIWLSYWARAIALNIRPVEITGQISFSYRHRVTHSVYFSWWGNQSFLRPCRWVFNRFAGGWRCAGPDFWHSKAALDTLESICDHTVPWVVLKRLSLLFLLLLYSALKCCMWCLLLSHLSLVSVRWIQEISLKQRKSQDNHVCSCYLKSR